MGPSDKVQLTKYPIAPSTCVVCLRSADGELNFIDFQMSLDVYGSVNICVECLAPIAQLLGFVEKNFLDDADEQIRNLVDMNRKLTEDNGKLRSTLDSLFDLRPDLIDRSVDVDEAASDASETNDLALDFELNL